MQPTLRLGKGNVDADAPWPGQRPGLRMAGLSPKWTPSKRFRAETMSVMLPALGRSPALSAAFCGACPSTVRPMPTGRKRGLTVDSCPVLSAEARWRPWLSDRVRQCRKNVT